MRWTRPLPLTWLLILLLNPLAVRATEAPSPPDLPPPATVLSPAAGVPAAPNATCHSVGDDARGLEATRLVCDALRQYGAPVAQPGQKVQGATSQYRVGLDARGNGFELTLILEDPHDSRKRELLVPFERIEELPSAADRLGAAMMNKVARSPSPPTAVTLPSPAVTSPLPAVTSPTPMPPALPLTGCVAKMSAGGDQAQALNIATAVCDALRRRGQNIASPAVQTETMTRVYTVMLDSQNGPHEIRLTLEEPPGVPINEVREPLPSMDVLTAVAEKLAGRQLEPVTSAYKHPEVGVFAGGSLGLGSHFYAGAVVLGIQWNFGVLSVRAAGTAEPLVLNFSTVDERAFDRAVLVGFCTRNEFSKVSASIGYGVVEGVLEGAPIEDSDIFNDHEAIPYRVNGIPWEVQLLVKYRYIGFGLYLYGNLNEVRSFWGTTLMLQLGVL